MWKMNSPATSAASTGATAKPITMSAPIDSLIAGSVAGSAAVSACHPFDVVRTRLQLGSSSNNVFQCLRDILRSEGLRGLYSGLMGPFFAQAVYKSIVFSTHHVTSDYIFTGPKSMYTDFSAGCIAGTVNTVVVAPVEQVRTRMILKNMHYWECVRGIVQSTGVSGLWRGFIPAALRDGPGVGVFFAVSSSVKRVLNEWDTEKRYQYTIKIIAGSLAGIGFWVYGLPLDTIKTNLESKLKTGNPVGLLTSTTRDLLAEGGVSRLYRGWQAALTRGAPSSAITLTTYDVVYEHMMKRRGMDT